MARPDIRNDRTEAAIKDALLELLNHKSLQDISVSELARAAGVSRSTFYAHFNNLEEVQESAFLDYAKTLMSLQGQMKTPSRCEGCGDKKPFCWSLRAEDKNRVLVNDPQFSERLLDVTTEDIFQGVLGDIYSPSTVALLRRFQLAGCLAAATHAETDEEWTAAQDAIDTFIRGGLAALRDKKRQ